ncbi:TPA: hypothetical protein DCX15_01405 [bacterium]|nr:hypothetical protein [bacterium]
MGLMDEIITPPLSEVKEGRGEEESLATEEAVAVKNRDSFPQILAKGRGEMAQAIIQAAKRLDIPIYEDPDLLEALSALDVGSRVPDELYPLITQIITFIYEANKRFGYESL